MVDKDNVCAYYIPTIFEPDRSRYPGGRATPKPAIRQLAWGSIPIHMCSATAGPPGRMRPHAVAASRSAKRSY